MFIFSRFINTNAAKFLRSCDHYLSPTKFYIIPKIHKNPMVGRPIAGSHSYITRPLNIFVDEYVKPRLHMPTVLRDSGELIQALESIRLPPHCFLVTADVVSLYLAVSVVRMIVSNLRMLLTKVVSRFFTKMIILALCSFVPIRGHLISICTFLFNRFIPQATREPLLEVSSYPTLKIAPRFKLTSSGSSRDIYQT